MSGLKPLTVLRIFKSKQTLGSKLQLRKTRVFGIRHSDHQDVCLMLSFFKVKKLLI